MSLLNQPTTATQSLTITAVTADAETTRKHLQVIADLPADCLKVLGDLARKKSAASKIREFAYLLKTI